ncbi:MAG: glycosyltransferase family 4 protein [Planctomycetes bacterium]|nr:glycosyltransferase family 4 protein [Planctomycetota bacterium]
MPEPDRPLRILHLTAGSDAGGLSRYIFDMCSAMKERGHQVAVAGEKGAWHWLFERAPWPWIDVPLKGNPIALWKASSRLTHWMSAHPVDLIHTHYRRASLVARRLQRGFGVNILYTLHLSNISLSGVNRFLSDFGDHTHAASADAVKWLVESARVPQERITLIPHGIDPARFPRATAQDQLAARHKFDVPADALVAAFVGRLDTPKNEEWLLDLAARSHAALPSLVILMAGEGPHEAALRARIQKEGLAQRVRLLGHQDPLPVYQAADAVLLPSAREGFSLVCTEGMCVGRPVLRTQTSGTSEHIIESVTGHSVPIDRTAFLDAATVFLSDRAALERMGGAASEHVRQNLTFDRQFDDTLALYRRLSERFP